jgi:hypothetical protein
MESPNLVEIRSESGAKTKQNIFSLSVNLKVAKPEDAAAKVGGKS